MSLSASDVDRLTPTEKRKLLADLLRKQQRETPATAPLTYGQEAIWRAQQAAPDSPAYNLVFYGAVQGPFEVPVIEWVFERLAERHPALRTTFSSVEGVPQQAIHPAMSLKPRQIDAQRWSDERLQQEFDAIADRRFDLERGPLISVAVFYRGAAEHLLLVTVHHLVCDFVSMATLVREIFALYLSRLGLPLELSKITATLANFALRERASEVAVRWQAAREYWLNQLSGELPRTELAGDFPRPPVQTFAGARHSFELNESLTQQVRESARRTGATLYSFMLAAFQALLSRYTGQDDILVGSPTAGRASAEDQQVVGHFANPVAMRARLAGDLTFSELVAQAQAAVLAAIEHQEYPLPLLVRELKLPIDASRTQLFQVLFAWERLHIDELELIRREGLATPSGRFRLTELRLEQRGAPYDLIMQVFEMRQSMSITLQYNTGLYRPESMARLARQFTMLLSSATENMHRRISELALIAPEERRQLAEWNATAADYPLEVSLHQQIERQAARTPDRIAVVFEHERLTYRELNSRANQLAHHLRSLGVGRDTVVGVCLERSLEMVWGLLGILKAGGAYLPLEPDLPAERIDLLLADARVSHVLAQATTAQLVSRAEHVLDLQSASPAWSSCSSEDPAEQTSPDDLAYVIYTSGSTGRPKGVMIPHRGVCNRLLWMQDRYRLSQDDHVLQKTPYSFDVSVWEFFWPLMTGARLIVARPGGHRDAPYLAGLIEAEQITTLHFVPSMLHIFLEQPGLARLRSLRRVICSGEALSVELQEQFFARLDAELHNLYGPTEASIDVTAWQCERGDARLSVPIGRPIANTQIHILDRTGRLAPLGVPGELCIGGVGLARGYLNDPQRTAESFVELSPDGEPPTRLYRTGDIACLLDEGTIEFIGRADRQIKIRGQRIELGEIQAALEEHPAVRQAFIKPFERGPQDWSLAAYLVAADSPIDMRALRQYLRGKLPRHMAPADLMVLESFPLTPSGKIDSRALPVPQRTREASSHDWVAPRTLEEIALAEAWREALGCDRIGLHDDLFELGANSLQLHQLHLASVRLGWKATIDLLFRNPTIESLIAACQAASSAAVPRLELAREVVLDPVIAPGDVPRAASPPRAVLLTGATGFLGAFLLEQLLEQTSAQVWCLVRAADEKAALERLEKSGRQLGVWRDEWRERIVPLVGDLDQPALGLAADVYEQAAANLDAIYHNGAQVNFLLPYSALEAANVSGTREVLRLASQCQLKPVHFISSLSVFDVQPAARGAAISESSQLADPDAQHGTGYGQSKWVADSIVQVAARRGIPAAVYRPGMITPHSRTGASNPDDLASRMLASVAQVQAAPRLDLVFHAAPVDFVAAAIVRLSQSTQLAGEAWHLAAPGPLAWQEVLEHMRASGVSFDDLPGSAWLDRLAGHDDNAMSALLPLVAGGDLAARLESLGMYSREAAPRFDCAATLAALASRGLKFPDAELTFLTGVLPGLHR